MIWDWRAERKKMHARIAAAFVAEMIKRPNRKVKPVAIRIGRKFEVGWRTVYRCVAEQRERETAQDSWQ